MTDSDPLLRMLERLPALEADRARAERARARCHAAMARRARRREPPPGGASAAAALLERGLLGGLGLAYLAAVLHDVFRMRDL